MSSVHTEGRELTVDAQSQHEKLERDRGIKHTCRLPQAEPMDTCSPGRVTDNTIFHSQLSSLGSQIIRSP